MNIDTRYPHHPTFGNYEHHHHRHATSNHGNPPHVPRRRPPLASFSMNKSDRSGFNLSPNRGRRRARVELTEDQKQELREAFELFDADKKVG